MSSEELQALTPARVLEGGDLDCGSGLVLLLRETMLGVPEGQVLELTSREVTVKDDLPPWCRMVGHDYLGSLPGKGCTRFFVRRGAPVAAQNEIAALAEDKERARGYEWRTRVRHSGHLKSTVYCRNFSFEVGQPASFEEKDAHPSAVEVLLGALGASLAVAFATQCSRAGLAVDDIELSVRGRLANVMAHLGLEPGDPSFSRIAVKCFASTFEDEEPMRTAWQHTVERSPILATLRKAVAVELELAVV